MARDRRLEATSFSWISIFWPTNEVNLEEAVGLYLWIL